MLLQRPFMAYTDTEVFSPRKQVYIYYDRA
jgi:hypothetical protein